MPASDTDPPVVELYNVVLGDTWPGISTIGPITFQGPDDPLPIAPTTSIASATLNFYLEGEKNPSLRLGSAAGSPAPITIVNAATWELSIPPINAPVFLRRAGVYYGQLKIVDDAGTKFTTHTFRQEVTVDTGVPQPIGFNGTTSVSGTNTGDVTLGASLEQILDISGQTLSAEDLGSDKLWFWDESAGVMSPLTLGTNLSISGTTLNAVAGGGGSDLTSYESQIATLDDYPETFPPDIGTGASEAAAGNHAHGATSATAQSDHSTTNFGTLLKSDGFGSVALSSVSAFDLRVIANGGFYGVFRADTVDNPLSATRYYKVPNADGIIALTSSLTGIPDALHNGTLTGTTWTFGTGAAAAFLTAAGGGATGQALFGAATVAAARVTLGEYITYNTSTVTATTQNVYVDLTPDVTLPPGFYQFELFQKGVGPNATYWSRILFGSGASFLSNDDRIGQALVHGGAGTIFGNDTTKASNIGIAGGTWTGFAITGAGTVRITTETTAKLQFTNTGASGTMTCYESVLRFRKIA